MKKIIPVFILLITACICISCFHTDKEHTKNPIESANVNVTENSDFVPRRSPNPEVIIENSNFKEIKLDLLDGYEDYYECIVFNQKGESIFSEILGPYVNPPKISVKNDTVNIHFGAGTGTYLDKFIDYKRNLKSDWIQNVRAIGKEYVSYVRNKDDDTEEHIKTLVVAKKYEQNTEKKYSFPHISDEWDIDKYEFKNNETELYIHYIDKDTKKEAEKTIKLSEFK